MLFLEKVVDNEELMECIRGDPVIQVRSSLKLSERKKKCMEKNILCTNVIHDVSVQTRYDTIRLVLLNGQNVHETSKKRKQLFLFKASIPPLLVTANLSKPKANIQRQNISTLQLYGNAVPVVDPTHVPQGVLRHYGYMRTCLCKWKYILNIFFTCFSK